MVSMKNYKKGFIIPLLIIIVTLLAVGGGIYTYSKNKSTNIQNIGVDKNTSTATQQVVFSSTTTVSIPAPIQSDNEAIIQAVLNMKNILISGDVIKIRSYFETENADNPKYLAQIKSMSDTELLLISSSLSKSLSMFNATFVRTQCKITITGNTASVSYTKQNSGGSGSFSLNVKKINGVWQ